MLEKDKFLKKEGTEEVEDPALGVDENPVASPEPAPAPMPEKEEVEEVEVKEETVPTPDAGTSPAPELNNRTVPTVEEEENADMVPHEASSASMFTQEQVNEIAGKIRAEAREKAMRDMLTRYGVADETELDNLFADSQKLGTLQEIYDTDKTSWESRLSALEAELASLREDNALLESGIDRERYDDARFILKGKGLGVTAESIAQELATHPEWKHEEPVAEPTAEKDLPFAKKEEAPTRISVLGNKPAAAPGDEAATEREQAMKLFFGK